MTVVTNLALADLLDEAGLTGRGGGAFPTGAKLRAARASHAELIVNACDGEPGSLKDAWVVREHLAELVHGAGLLAGGAPVRFAAHQGSATLAGLQAGGVPTLEVPARYVSSQESALVSLAAGGLARPMTARVPIVLGGRDGAGRPVTPTLVVNAETAWRVTQVSERGPAWFRSHGTPDEPGPRLVTLTGHLPRPGVLDTAAGLALADLLAAGGPSATTTDPSSSVASPVVSSLRVRRSRRGGRLLGWPPSARASVPARSRRSPPHLPARAGRRPRAPRGRRVRWAVRSVHVRPARPGPRHRRGAHAPGPSQLGRCTTGSGCCLAAGRAASPTGSRRSSARRCGPTAVISWRTAQAGVGGERQPEAHVVHLAVDRVACTGHGVCAALLDGWVLDPEGYPVVLDDRASPAEAATVERMCPARAIYPRAPRSG